METKVTVSKKLILQFTLPGYMGASSGVDNAQGDPFQRQRRQLETPSMVSHAEHWTLDIDTANALGTLSVLRELVRCLETAIGEGKL